MKKLALIAVALFLAVPALAETWEQRRTPFGTLTTSSYGDSYTTTNTGLFGNTTYSNNSSGSYADRWGN